MISGRPTDPKQEPSHTLETTVAEHVDGSAEARQTTVSSGLPPAINMPERYSLVEILGTGATGRVVAVRDHTFDRVVAAKVLSNSDGVAMARFIREARITASLEHPNITPIHDLEFPAAGPAFFTMRRISGISLGEALRQADSGSFPKVIASINDRITVVLKVANALARAHSNGVIHQDVKPDNIMLGGQGEVLLVDWGEARLRGESRTTQPSTIGTPAYMSPEQARGEMSTEASDIYGLGTTLFQTLLLRLPTWDPVPDVFWAKKRAGIIDPLTIDEQGRVPRRLLAVVMKAIAPNPADRYPSITAFAADLGAFQAGQSVSAYHEHPLVRILDWGRRHIRTLTVATAFLAVIGTAGWLLLAEHLKEMAAWGSPVLVESFNASWTERWSPLVPGTYMVRDGTLMNAGTGDNRLLMNRQFVTGSLAVEVTIWVEPGARLGDICVVWIDAGGYTGSVPPDALVQNGGLEFAICGAFNSVAALRSRSGNDIIQQVPMTIETGRAYRLRVMIDGPQLTLDVDGHRVIEERMHLPRGPGYFGLQNRFPGVQFSDLRVWVKGVAQKIDILSIGDTFVQEGHPELGARAYNRVVKSFPGTALAEEAMWREGLVRTMASDPTGADLAWKNLTSQTYLDQVAARRLEMALAQPDWSDTEAFTALYRRAPEIRSWLRRMWNARVAMLDSSNVADSNRMLSLKRELFPDEFSTATQECSILFQRRRFQEIIDRQPGQKRWNAFALLSMGRFDEALAISGDVFAVDIDVRWSLGQYQAVLDDELRYPPPTRASALLWMGRVGEAAALLGNQPSAHLLLAQGLAREALALPQCGSAEAQAALWVLDRTAEAVAGDPAFPKRGKAGYGLLLSDDPAIALRNLSEDRHPAILLLLHRIRGEPDAERAARTRLNALPEFFQYDITWFSEYALPAVLDRLEGDPHALITLREASRTRLRGMWSGHLQPFVEFILGDIDEQAFLAQPCRSEAPLWLLLARGLRSEFAGDRAGALTAYSAWTELPRWRRLCGVRPAPNVLAERLVAWRLQILGGARPETQR